MSSRGKPSRGCKRCVTKKVKCDQLKPICQRCLKAGASCEYRDPFELVHRNQTQNAERAAKEKWRQRTTKTHTSDDSLLSSASSSPESNRKSASPSQANSVAIWSAVSTSQISMRPSLEEMAFNRFLYDFVSPSEPHLNIGGAFDPLPAIYSASSANSPLRCAISAVSLANFGGRLRSPEASQQGAMCYGKALGSFANAISGPKDKLKTNEALLGIYLLGAYEMLTSSTFDGTYRTHQRGAASILQERSRDGTFENVEQTRYLGVIYVQVVMNCLTEGSLPPPFNPSWQLFYKGNPRNRLTELMHRTATVRHKLIASITASLRDTPGAVSPGTKEMGDLLEEALELDSRLDEWYQDTVVGLQWISPREPLLIHAEKRPQWARELFGLPGAPERMHIYKSILATLGANLYRGARILLNMSILRRASRMASGLAAASTKRLYLEQIASTTAALLIELIEETCMAIPCLLQLKADVGTGDAATPDDIFGFRGMVVFWSLASVTIAFTQPTVRALDMNLRRPWVHCVMVFLRNSLSLAKAEAFQGAVFRQPSPFAEESYTDVLPPFPPDTSPK